MKRYLSSSTTYYGTPTTRSTYFPTEHNQLQLFQLHLNLPSLAVRSSIHNPVPLSTGLQMQTGKELSMMLRTDAAIKAIEQKANSKRYTKLWPKAVLEALDEAIRERRWKSAIKIFGLLRHQHWYEPRCQTFAKLLMMLGKCRQPEEAGVLFEIMLSEGLEPTIDVYTSLASAYGQSGQLEEAFATINDMKSVSECKPDVYTYSILIKCCIKCHRVDLIQRVLAEMSYEGIECNTVTYNTIIDGYGKAQMFEEMENSIIDMVECGNSMPDIFTLNSVIGAYGNCRHIDMMEKWYNEFQHMGIMPDIKTFNILIRSYGKAGMYMKMMSVLEFMEKRYFSPNVVTFNTIIEVFGKDGNVKEMDAYFKQMKHLGLKPNNVTYCILVSAYQKAGLLTKVNSILMQVENSDVILDAPFFNCIISAYGEAGDVEKMAELFLMMKERNCEPDGTTFSTMIRVYNAQGMTTAAQQLESKMIATGKSFGTRLLV